MEKNIPLPLQLMNVQTKNISNNIWSEFRKSRTLFFSCFLSVSPSDSHPASTKLERGLLLQRLISRNENQRLSRREIKISALMSKSRNSFCRSTAATMHADVFQVAG